MALLNTELAVLLAVWKTLLKLGVLFGLYEGKLKLAAFFTCCSTPFLIPPKSNEGSLNPAILGVVKLFKPETKVVFFSGSLGLVNSLKLAAGLNLPPNVLNSEGFSLTVSP